MFRLPRPTSQEERKEEREASQFELTSISLLGMRAIYSTTTITFDKCAVWHPLFSLVEKKKKQDVMKS